MASGAEPWPAGSPRPYWRAGRCWARLPSPGRLKGAHWSRSSSRPGTFPPGESSRRRTCSSRGAPGAYAPSGSESAAALVGRRLSGPVAAGEVLTTTRVAGAGLLVGRPADEVAVHVPLADPGAVAMVRAGDHVDVLAGTGETVAASALVLAVRGADAGTGLSGGVGAALGGDGGGLVLAVTAAVAGRIASAPRDEIGGSSLTVVLRSR